VKPADNKCLDAVPPIPGYRGFIPHVRTSDVGLGSRFHNMAREGYDALYMQQLEEQQQQKDLCCDDADADDDAVQPANNDGYLPLSLSLSLSIVGWLSGGSVA